MSKYIDKRGKTILHFSLPKDKLRLILKELQFPNVEEISKVTFEEKRIVILVAFREFLKGHFLLEEFSEIASELKMLFPSETRTPEQEDYELMIFEAADLSLYVRKFDAPTESMFAGFLETVWDYFNKYKQLLNNLPNRYSIPSPFEQE